MDFNTLYNSMTLNGQDPTTTTNPGDVTAINTAMPGFICPSSGGTPFQTSSGGTLNTGGLTNYKAMAATYVTSLNALKQLSSGGAVAVYGSGTHPDGAMPPSLNGAGTSISQLADGASHTILLTETMETTTSSHNAAARWAVGSEVFLCGMTSTAVGTPAQYQSTYFAPAGYTGTLGSCAQASTSARCYLNYHFVTVSTDTYEAPTGMGPTVQPQYGPSSGHPAVVNHLMGDGSVQSLNKNLYIEVYFFLITKSNGDPFYLSNTAGQ
jgi:hypothetical protein